MLRPLVSLPLTVLVDVVAWGAFHSLTGYAAHRIGEARLHDDGRLLRIRGFEAGGGWYRRRLHIQHWKDAVPEAGELFRGGVSKRTLGSRDDAGLRAFARETRRAELGHWWAMGCGPLFAWWNPPGATALLVAYGVGVNLPFIAIQRYNRARVQAVLDLRRRRDHPAGTPARRATPGA